MLWLIWVDTDSSYEARLEAFMRDLPDSSHTYLDKEIDFDNGDIHKDLQEIARAMIQWEILAPYLDLTYANITDIKQDYFTAFEQR